MPPLPAEAPRSEASSTTHQEARAPWLDGLQRGLDRLLVLDVFLVLAGAAWFGVAVGLHSRGNDSALRAFQQLWPLVFQPAIGLLMGAALLSGGLGWWRRQGQR